MAGVGGVSCRRQTNNKITLAFNHSGSLKTFKRKKKSVSKKAKGYRVIFSFRVWM